MRKLISLLFLGAAACAAPTDETGETATESAAVIAPAADVVRLRYEPQFVLEKVLEQKQRPFDAAKPFPAIKFASEITLTEFQDAIETQWGFRPDVITNAYSVVENTIYLMDDAAYYSQHGRCIDDSLAHEITHYVQVVYQGWTLEAADDSIEVDAVYMQRWFRQEYCGAS
ncbi:MAG: hypothetical protein KIT84_04175 [Labilithrix sp.]|nr:hypothetical protein [Labilithrix sp.]MCW5810183.1 hypothetical protein [Labilithrix sp.]